MSAKRYPSLGDIEFGEPDANSEFFSSLQTSIEPIFLDCFLTPPSVSITEFESFRKYIVYGQKGTGKTTFLRNLERNLSNKDHITEFVIFKKEFLEEIDISDYTKTPIIIDEEEIKKKRHFQHIMKRLLMFIILSKLTFTSDLDSLTNEILDSSDRSFVSRIRGMDVSSAVKLGIDSIVSVFKSAGIDASQIGNPKFELDTPRLVKRLNDDILNFIVRRLKKSNARVSIFLDEIHYAYRSNEALLQDAMLVRDTILACQSLNDRFAKEAINICVFIAVRAEYLEHPIIATADINHAIESVGQEIIWSQFPLNKNHPLYEMIYLRFKKTIGDDFSEDDLFRVYFANIDAQYFLENTWSKPRDFIRFFKCAKALYPRKSAIVNQEFNAIWRKYAEESWREMKSAASAFLPPAAITELEQKLNTITPKLYDSSLRLDVNKFKKILEPIYNIAQENHSNLYSFDHFIHLMYIVGIFYTKRIDYNKQEIFHSYHRGNRTYHSVGDVLIHPTVMKAFG